MIHRKKISNKKMTMRKCFKYLKPLEAIRETAHGLYKAGVMHKTITQEFDMLCVQQIKETK